jgi:hypothetical protein
MENQNHITADSFEPNNVILQEESNHSWKSAGFHFEGLHPVLENQIRRFLMRHPEQLPPGVISHTRLKSSKEWPDDEWLHVPSGARLELFHHILFRNENKTKKIPYVQGRDDEGQELGPWIIVYANKLDKKRKFSFWKIWHGQGYSGGDVDSLDCEAEPSIRRSWAVTRKSDDEHSDTSFRETSSPSVALPRLRRTVRKAIPGKLRSKHNQAGTYFRPNTFGVLSNKPRDRQDYSFHKKASRTRKRQREEIDLISESETEQKWKTEPTPGSPSPRADTEGTNSTVPPHQTPESPFLTLAGPVTGFGLDMPRTSPEPTTHGRSEFQANVSQNDFRPIVSVEDGEHGITIPDPIPSVRESATCESALGLNGTAPPKDQSAPIPGPIPSARESASYESALGLEGTTPPQDQLASGPDCKTVSFRFVRRDKVRQNHAPRSYGACNSVDKLRKHAKHGGVFDPTGHDELVLSITGTSESAFLSWEPGMDEPEARQESFNNIVENAASMGRAGQKIEVTVCAP